MAKKGSALFSRTMVGRTYLFTSARSSVRAFMDWPKGRSYPSRLRPIRGAGKTSAENLRALQHRSMLQFHGCTGIGAEEALSEMAGLSSFDAAGLSGFDAFGPNRTYQPRASPTQGR